MSQLAMITDFTLAVLVAITQLSTICTAQPLANSDGDTSAENSTVAELFLARDADKNGSLTEEELVKGGGQDEAALKRDFKVFDANTDGLLSEAEFLSIPAFTPEEKRSTIPDPVVFLSAARYSELESHWSELDQDADGSLNQDEFDNAKISQNVRGLESLGFNDWDLDEDTKVSKDEVAKILDMAYGVRSPTGELLRYKTGQVIDWRMFREMNPDENGKVLRQEYIKVLGSVEAAEKWFPGINSGTDERFTVTEFSKSGHRIDPVNTFLGLDTDLDGRLSPKEMGGLPAGWGPPGKNWLAGFDDDGDGTYSLREFQFIPQVNLLASWQSAQDTNQDGKLSVEEFRFMPAPALAALSAEYFAKLDLDNDKTLSLKEWTFNTSHPDAKFLMLDADADGELTEAEFVSETNLPVERLRRDFKVFDADGNSRMTHDEFLSIPHWVPESQRTTIPDPVVLLSEAGLSRLTRDWADWDKNSDGVLDAEEFETSPIRQTISGMEQSGFDEWDQDHDKRVSREAVAQVLDIAFGVRSPTGELLRSNAGAIVDWRSFLGFNPDSNGKALRADYIQSKGSLEKARESFPGIDETTETTFSVTDFAKSSHRIDSVQMFLHLDVDLNGLLSPEEMQALPAWGPPGKNWLPGFDDNGDGSYSLHEFRLIPQINLLTTWHAARDADGDGKLSLQEFRFMPSPALAALSAEYFRRLDLDNDHSLSLREWPFQTSHPDARFMALDTDTDGELTAAEFVAEGSLPADRMQRDFSVFDTDGSGRLSPSEFRTIVYWVSENLQTTVLDPVVSLSKSNWTSLASHWEEWDTDADGSLSEGEFANASPGKLIRGLETAGFADWDLAHDGKTSREDAALVVDVAFGVRAITGELLRSNSGYVVDWDLFKGLDVDGDGRVIREDYLRILKDSPNAEELFRNIAKDGGGSFGGTEFVTSMHRTNPIYQFLALDMDLSGELSPGELKSIPWGPAEKKWLPGFDDDDDGAYSLLEFMQIPYINILAGWHTAHDLNQDGMLSQAEFKFGAAPTFAALSVEYFRRLDVNQDQTLSLSEWPFITSNPTAKFTAIDTDADGELTEAEFMREGNLPLDRLRRDFKVFDADSNGQMTKAEFMSIPHWVPENQRTVIPDPAALLSESKLLELTKNWTDWDKDGDGFLDSDEFQGPVVTRKISGLEMTGFVDWDQDHDKKVSKEDVARTIDIAFGVCTPTGELLRSKTGQVTDWRGFLSMNPDENGKVSREAYIKMIGTSAKPETWFPTIYAAGNEKFGVTEYLTSNHKTDPISHFLSLDADLNGLLSPIELDALPPGWGPPGKNWLPGFDEDHDGAYSLQEFRFIPHLNLLTTWYGARDTDSDGKLSSQEFHFMPTPALAALSKEYFRRLDVDNDGFLTLKEWSFSFDFARVPRDVIIELRDRNGDHVLNFEEVLGEMRRPEPGDKVDVNQEAGLARMEEAFSRADVNADGQLDRQELSSDDGLEAISPGSSGVARKVNFNSMAPVSKLAGLEDASLETYLIIEVNVLLVVGVAIYLFRKRDRKK